MKPAFRVHGALPTESVWVGYPRKRTIRTAMREAARMENDWWARHGHPEVRYVATSAQERTIAGRRGWFVTVTRLPG